MDKFINNKKIKYSECCTYPISGDWLEKLICPRCKEHCNVVELDDDYYGDLLDWELEEYERDLDEVINKLN